MGSTVLALERRPATSRRSFGAAVEDLHSVTAQLGDDPGRKAVAGAPMCEQQIGQMRA
jgi:hypothetical protein